jgi:hypothetical protein
MKPTTVDPCARLSKASRKRLAKIIQNDYLKIGLEAHITALYELHRNPRLMEDGIREFEADKRTTAARSRAHR